MARVSKFKVDKHLQEAITDQLWNFLGNINSSKVSAEFFSNFLYESEKIMLAKRFAILVLLSRDKTPSEIQKSLNVTFSSIGMVSAWLKNAHPETKKLLINISRQKSWEKVFDYIDEVLNKIPPGRHSDWTQEYANRYQRSLKRDARKSIR